MRLAGVLLCLAFGGAQAAQWGGELRLAIRSDPRTLNPVLVDNESAETFRYLTGGVLVRINRATQQLEPQLATSWKLENRGRTIVFHLRQGVAFSDGTPFTADDVAYTMGVLLDPKLHSPTGDAFRSGTGPAQCAARDRYTVAITFPEVVAGVARLFDQVAIMSRRSPLKENAVLGPFQLAERKAGSYILLRRNPRYWRTDQGRRLPYLDAVRLEIETNRQIELMRFERGEIQVMSGVDPESFDRIASARKAWFRDAGPSLEGEFLWFNMRPSAPLPEYKKRWFDSRNFRRAISLAIHRDDLCRVVWRGHAQPSAGPFSAANRLWFNARLKPPAFNLREARKLLSADGFREERGALRDRAGRAVEFSLITNAENRARERAAAMIQQDLAALGIRLNVVTLDFAALLERISKNFQYEACLLGLVNVDEDPNNVMNIFLSSAANHFWNPEQKSPETSWEAEIDRLMRGQASTPEQDRRKALFDRVQEIVADQSPALYLVNPNALVAASPRLRNLAPSVLRPQLLWNVDQLYFEGGK